MTKFILLLLLITGGSPSFLSIDLKRDLPEDRADFELTIADIPKEEGEIRIAVFNSKKDYQSKENPAFAIVITVDSKSITWSETGLPFGEYAIAVYHDKNENGELDTNFLGIPKEAYGFSNNARGKFGPASWKDAKFEVNSQTVSHTINIK